MHVHMHVSIGYEERRNHHLGNWRPGGSACVKALISWAGLQLYGFFRPRPKKGYMGICPSEHGGNNFDVGLM